jgi:hypothetical protein
MTSRYTWRTFTLDHLKNFVAIDNLTAQIPLIDLTGIHGKGRLVRIWTAYDHTRTYGTYTEVNANGMVRTITVYPSGRIVELINRPASKKGADDYYIKRTAKGVHPKAGQGVAKGQPRTVKSVLERAKVARATQQADLDDHMAQVDNSGGRPAKRIQKSK